MGNKKELSDIDKAIAKAKSKAETTPKDYKEADSIQKFKDRMGRGQPKKKAEEKATNKMLLYFNEAEIREIEEVAEINGFSKKDKNKYIKSIIKKIIRSELIQYRRWYNNQQKKEIKWIIHANQQH